MTDNNNNNNNIVTKSTIIEFHCNLCSRIFDVTTEDGEMNPGLLQKKIDMHGLTHKDHYCDYTLTAKVIEHSESSWHINDRRDL